MNNKLENFIQQLKNVQLPEAERTKVRTFLEEYTEANQPVRSPWVEVLSPLQNIARSAVVVAVMLLLVGGVTAAAEEALPGDPLYAVKINVNEAVMGLASMTSASEAENQSRIAARRISELETLAARGLLDANVSDSLTQAISEHAQSARQHIEEVSARGAAGNATSLETELLSILNTHSDILQDLAITRDGSYASTTAAAAQKLRDLAQAKVEDDVVAAVDNSSSLPVRVDKDAELSPQQTDELLKQTAARLKKARSEFANSYDTFSESDIRDGIEKLLVTSADSVDAAVDEIASKEYRSATELLQESLTYAHEVIIILNARHLLETSSGFTMERLLAGDTTASTTDKLATSTDLTSQEIDESLEIMSEDIENKEVFSVTSTTSTTTATGTDKKATSTATSSAGTTSSSSQNISRNQAVNTEAYKKIEAVLERIDETLSASEPRSRAGMLPGRSSTASGSSTEVGQ